MKKFSIDQEDLSSATSFCVKGVSSNPIIPAHGDIVVKIKDGVLYMKGLNHKFGLYDTIQVKSGDDLDLAVPGFDFHRIVNMLSGVLEFSFSPMNKTIEIKAGKSKYKLFAEEPIHYPTQKTTDAKLIMKIHADVLKNAIQATSASVKPDGLRPQIECMHIHRNGADLRAVALNMYSMSVDNRLEGECHAEAPEISVMPYVFAPIQGLSGKVEIKQNSSLTEYLSENKRRIVQLKSHGAFPVYNHIIDRDYTHRYIVDRNEFVGAISRTSSMANMKHHSIELTFSGGTLQVSGKDLDFNKEGVEEVSVEGNDESYIMVNAKLLLDLVSSRKIPKLELLLIDSKNPLRINGDDGISSMLMSFTC